MKKSIIIIIILAVIIIGAGVFLSSYKKPVPQQTDENNPAEYTGKNNTDFPLKLPAGFSISVFAKNLSGARVMALDPFGNMWVSRTSRGVITLLSVENNEVKEQNDILRNLKNPHGLAFDPQNPYVLYYAEENKISRIPTYSDADPEKIADLNGGGRHFTRTLLFGPDNRLYVSVGSSCDTCIEQNNQRAKVLVMDKDGKNLQEFVSGLRNSVFMALNPNTEQIWATEMGRDFLGDNLPPDEINILQSGKNYGWPICYGKNIHDDKFDKNVYVRTPCVEPFETPSHIDIQAHSAPLGLGFISGQGWPEEYQNNLLVAYHGSWNRSIPTGYKVVRFKLDKEGSPLGQEFIEDFIFGWLLENKTVLGRPVGILIGTDGVMYISDDYAGIIYKVTYNP